MKSDDDANRHRSESSSSDDSTRRERSRSKNKSRSTSHRKSVGSDERKKHRDSKSPTHGKSSHRSKERKKKKKRSGGRGHRSTLIAIGRLTSSVTREHVLEIFSQYGRIRSLEIAPDLMGGLGARGVVGGPFQRASVEYETRADASRARKYGNGGMIDRQEITVEIVSNRPSKKH